MREIKFRAWQKSTLSMRQVLVIDYLNNVIDLVGGEIEQYFEDVELMQYTGLKDKNGTEIYEGDIGWDDYQEVYGKVVFDDGAFRYEWENISEELFEMAGAIEIVGNVWEDGDLINDGKRTKEN